MATAEQQALVRVLLRPCFDLLFGSLLHSLGSHVLQLYTRESEQFRFGCCVETEQAALPQVRKHGSAFAFP